MAWQSIQNAVTERVPVKNWENAYNFVPVPAVELRGKLLAVTSDGGKDDPAARYLDLIDNLRDEHDAPESKPRQSNLASGKPWPILASRQSPEDAS